MQQKLNWHDDLLMNGESLSPGKNPTMWILDHHFQESTDQHINGYKYEEFYHYHGLFQNTNLQLNLYSNT